MKGSGIGYYVLICDKKKKAKFIDVVSSYGAGCIDSMYGKGSAKAGALAKALGLETEEHKVIITCLLTMDKARALTEALKSEYGFQEENTGFAFCIPVGGLSIG